ncbi:MAG: flagellin lysine-N-methylase [Chitinispirillia bacterium]|nr:flagellin lysine-N-methylase [Chitinispirillia bacterium]
MPKQKRVILQPEYLSRFSCIGAACEDSCCLGTWNIFVDKKTFLKYRDVGDPELQADIDRAVKRNRGENASDEMYAKLGMFATGGADCVLLGADKLCRIQSKLGGEYLCDVCALYPRIYKMAGRKIERCATMSCPEAARMALMNPNGLAFESVDESPAVGRIPARVAMLNPDAPEFENRPLKYFWDVRMLCILLLQDRSYTLGQRLIIIGMLCQKIDELDKAGRTADIPAMLEAFDADTEDGALKPEFEQVGNNFHIQMRIAKELTDKRASEGLDASVAYIKCLKETLVGLECFSDTPAAQVLDKYVENREMYVIPYLKEKEYMLENFVVNEFFQRMMPFGYGETAWDSYLFMCVIYTMVKLHMNGMAGCHKGLTDEIVVKLVQAFSKVVLHNANFMSDMVKLLKDNGFNTLAWTAILVND